MKTMKIFMYVNGMPFDGLTLTEVRDEKGNITKPAESLGGSETMGLMAAEEMAKRGHSAFVFSRIPDNTPKTVNGVVYLPVGDQNEQTPFGSNFQAHARSIPHDVLIAQRAPGIFTQQYNSKLNYWWTHDLALKRYIGGIMAQQWNVDRILAVSDWHAEQVKSVYGVSNTAVFRNGIRLDLYPTAHNPERKQRSKTILYSHRPERGLVNLVGENGVMDQLAKVDPEIKLLVCSYNHSHPAMAGQYGYLYRRCSEMPNVENIGFLSKQELAVIQANCWLHVYPTEFEETSCITVMEQQAAGTPIVATRVGALPETLQNGGVYWIDHDGSSRSVIANTVKAVSYISKNPDKWLQLHKKALGACHEYSITASVDGLEQLINDDFKARTSDKERLYRHFMYYSDIHAAGKLAEKYGLRADNLPGTSETYPSYAKTDGKETSEFYNAQAEYHQKINNDHRLGDFQHVLNRIPRLKSITDYLSKMPEGSRILDYGCCVGQNTHAWANEFKSLQFTGVDLSDKQIHEARRFTAQHNVGNVRFYPVITPEDVTTPDFDLVICTEVLEHINDYHKFLTSVEKIVKPGGRIILTTPHGPHDANVQDRTTPIEHVHHFEEADILDIVGHKKDLQVLYVRDNDNRRQDILGNMVWSWTVDKYDDIRDINYDRKFAVQAPKQTLSCCMIVDAEGDMLAKTLRSVKYLADEFVIGIDYQGDSLCATERTIKRIIPSANIFYLPQSPTEMGFGPARNLTIERATKDWILWIDADEIWQHQHRVFKYLRENEFDSYAIHQHHYTAEPPSVMKTDLPCRLFRNHKSIKFFGLVHEHPETEINKGAGRTFLIPAQETCIVHAGYETEQTRRDRFVRNWPLMVRDRKENPDRMLSKFLWIRDLAHKNRFEMEQNGGNITGDMADRANEAIEMWRGLLNDGNARLVIDSLPYVSECADLVMQGKSLHFRFAVDLEVAGSGDNINGAAPRVIEGRTVNAEDMNALIAKLAKEKTDSIATNLQYI